MRPRTTWPPQAGRQPCSSTEAFCGDARTSTPLLPTKRDAQGIERLKKRQAVEAERAYEKYEDVLEKEAYMRAAGLLE